MKKRISEFLTLLLHFQSLPIMGMCFFFSFFLSVDTGISQNVIPLKTGLTTIGLAVVPEINSFSGSELITKTQSENTAETLWRPFVTPRNEWFSKGFFEIHFDHHVSPRLETPGAGVDEAQIIDMLKRTNPNFVQFHSKGHPGWTTYPTKVPLGTTVPNLQKDMLRVWRDATKKLGVKFTVYYSGASDGLAVKNHPEWRRIDINGKSDENYMGLCLLSEYVDQLVLPQIKELILNYDVDGFWFDGDNWIVRACFCERCKERFKREYNLPLPTGQNDPNWFKYAEMQRNIFVEYQKKCADLIHSLKSTCLYCSNYYPSDICPVPTPDYIDWISGDVGGVRRTIFLAECNHYLEAEEVPWEQMQGHGLNGVPKSVEYLNQENAMTIATGGRVEIWDNPKPDASLSPYQVDQLENASKFAYARKSVWNNTEPVWDVALLHSANTHFNDGTGYYAFGSSLDRIRGANLALMQSHTHFQILNEDYLLRRLPALKVVVLSQQKYLSERLVQTLRTWVDRGGSLVVTGLNAVKSDVNGKLSCDIEDLLGVKISNDTIPNGIIPWNGYPLRTNATFYKVQPTTAQPLVHLRQNWREINPVELPHPVMTINHFGKGTVVYIPSDIFTTYWQMQYTGVQHFLEKALRLVYPEPRIETSAPKSVYFHVRKQGQNLITHLVNINVDWDMDQEAAIWPETIIPIGPISFKVRCDKPPVNLKIVPDGGTVNWRWDVDGVWVEIPSLHIHSAVVLENAM